MFLGTIASLQQCNPNIPMNIPMFRKAAGCRGKNRMECRTGSKKQCINGNNAKPKKAKP